MNLLNAFSLGMLSGQDAEVDFRVLSIEEVVYLAKNSEVCSYIGHADTALLLSAMLETDIEVARRGFDLIKSGSGVTVVAQYNGPRLPEGATSLPEGAKIVFYQVSLAGAAC